jgi:hypothetical protein
MASLDDVLSDKPIEREKPEVTEKAPPATEARAEPEPPKAEDGQPTRHNLRREHKKKEWAAQGRDPETGQFTPKAAAEAPKEPAKAEAPKEEPKKEVPKAAEPAKAAAPAQEMTEKERAAFAAAADERRKRQALEQEIAQLRAGPAKPAEPAKSFWDDPDGALKTEEQRRAADRIHVKLQTAEMIGRQRYQDFDAKIQVFRGLVQQNPALVQAWISSPDPAEYAYRLAANHEELQQVGGLEAMRKKIEEDTAARVRAEEEAKYKAKEDEAAKLRASLPPTLSDVRGGTTNKAPSWGGPRPLGDVLGGKG